MHCLGKRERKIDPIGLIVSGQIVLQPGILESQNAMTAVDGATIERRIRINRPDDENTRCKVSRAWDPRDFSQYMQQPTTLSTSSAISPQQGRQMRRIKGFVTLPNRARNNSAGMSGSRRGDDCVPCLHRRCSEGSVRPC